MDAGRRIDGRAADRAARPRRDPRGWGMIMPRGQWSCLPGRVTLAVSPARFDETQTWREPIWPAGIGPRTRGLRGCRAGRRIRSGPRARRRHFTARSVMWPGGPACPRGFQVSCKSVPRRAERGSGDAHRAGVAKAGSKDGFGASQRCRSVVGPSDSMITRKVSVGCSPPNITRGIPWNDRWRPG
jgi:hypothetical protein